MWCRDDRRDPQEHADDDHAAGLHAAGADAADPVPVGAVDRDVATDVLRTHVGAGTLEIDEFERRLDLVLTARTTDDLDAAVDGLPPVRTARAIEAERMVARLRLARWAGLAALLVVIWAVTGAGWFWPVWPILGTAGGVVSAVRTLLERAAPSVQTPEPVWPRR